MSARDWAELPFDQWTDEDLRACARWWAEELGLGSWTVTACFKRGYEMNDVLGRNKLDCAYETSDITILVWDERDSESRDQLDVEVDVVHEMVHARFWVIGEFGDIESTQHKMLELAVERTARALVRQRRRAAR